MNEKRENNIMLIILNYRNITVFITLLKSNVIMQYNVIIILCMINIIYIVLKKLLNKYIIK
jgi:hypothetical protein